MTYGALAVLATVGILVWATGYFLVTRRVTERRPGASVGRIYHAKMYGRPRTGLAAVGMRLSFLGKRAAGAWWLLVCLLVGLSTFALVVITAYALIAAVFGTRLAIRILRELDEDGEKVLVLPTPRVEDDEEDPAQVAGARGL
jgi:hypothetical protein